MRRMYKVKHQINPAQCEKRRANKELYDKLRAANKSYFEEKHPYTSWELTGRDWLAAKIKELEHNINLMERLGLRAFCHEIPLCRHEIGAGNSEYFAGKIDVIYSPQKLNQKLNKLFFSFWGKLL